MMDVRAKRQSDRGRQVLSDRLSAIAAGDKSALQDLYRRTEAKLFGVALRILNDRREAEDVLQDVYLSVWMKAADFDPERASPITWLATIVRNRSIDRVRQIGRRGERDLDGTFDPMDETPDAFDRLSEEDEQQVLADCIDELDARTRSAIRTAFYGGRTYQELADEAGVPLGTMKSVIRRGLIRLKGCLTR